MMVASMSMTIQPVSRLPATTSQGNPPGRRCSRDHTWRRARARTLAMASLTGSSRLSRSRCVVESEAGVPNKARWYNWSCSASATLVAPSTIAEDRHSRTCARSRQVALPPAGNSRSSAAVSPTRSATRCSSTAPACPTSPFPSATTRSRWPHPVRSLTEKVHLFLRRIRLQQSHPCSSGAPFPNMPSDSPDRLNTRG
jgi:hypothetical protein